MPVAVAVAEPGGCRRAGSARPSFRFADVKAKETRAVGRAAGRGEGKRPRVPDPALPGTGEAGKEAAVSPAAPPPRVRCRRDGALPGPGDTRGGGRGGGIRRGLRPGTFVAGMARPDPRPARLRRRDLLLMVLGTAAFLADLGTDLWMACSYVRAGHRLWGVLVLALLALSSLATQLFSWAWHHTDPPVLRERLAPGACLALLHLLQLGYLSR